MSGTGLFDEGLQPERTHLAWQRTVLALGLSCALSARFTAPILGVAGISASLVGLVITLSVYVSLRARYRSVNRSLLRGDSLERISAWPLALVAFITTLVGVMAVLYVALGAGEHVG